MSDANVPNRLPRKHNPKLWQWQDQDGQVHKITDLSREDLMQVVCDCIDALDQVEDLKNKIASVITDCKTGKLNEQEAIAPLPID